MLYLSIILFAASTGAFFGILAATNGESTLGNVGFFGTMFVQGVCAGFLGRVRSV